MTKRIEFMAVTLLLILLLLIPVLSSAMQSANYAIDWDVTASGGGPLASNAYAINATFGQAAIGTASSSSFEIGQGYWFASAAGPVDHDVFLPATARNLSAYAPPCAPPNNDCENNDTWPQAYGPLEPGATYSAFPEDNDDWYYFDLSTSRTVTAQLTNYASDGDLLLYADQTGGNPSLLEQWGKGGSAMTLGPRSLVAGKYYVRVFTSDDHSDTVRYNLVVAVQ